MTKPTTRQTTRRTNRPTTRDYPDEENMDAPLVPYISDSTERQSENRIHDLRRDIAALSAQLDRIETRMEDDR